MIFVYVIGGLARGPMKIGISASPDNRIKSLQTGSPLELRCFGRWQISTRATAEAIERRAHQCLSAERMTGEWFDVPDYAACGVAESLAYEIADPIGELIGRSVPAFKQVADQ